MTKFPRPAQAKNFYALDLGLRRDGVEVLHGYNSGRWCFYAAFLNYTHVCTTFQGGMAVVMVCTDI